MSIMSNNTFTDIIAKQMDLCGNLLISKGEEYAPDVDRLAAFRKAAALQQCSMAQAAFGMLAKHLVSVADMVTVPAEYSICRWEEKLSDSINYLLILRAIIQEEVSDEVYRG